MANTIMDGLQNLGTWQTPQDGKVWGMYRRLPTYMRDTFCRLLSGLSPATAAIVGMHS